MAERGRRGDITIDVHAVDLLRAAFVLPSRFVEDLRERGVPIGDGEATGVATRRTLEQEAVRLQIPPEDIRDVVRMATGRIVKMEGYPELLLEIKQLQGKDQIGERARPETFID
jgi:hypothetical protein